MSILTVLFVGAFVAYVQCHEPATIKGVKCTIPFVYHGHEYDGCTEEGDSRPWCATGPTYYKPGSGEWTYCCPTLSCQSDCSKRGGYKKNGNCPTCECNRRCEPGHKYNPSRRECEPESWLNVNHNGRKVKINLVFTVEAKSEPDYVKIMEGIIKQVNHYAIDAEHAVVTLFIYGERIERHVFHSFKDLVNFFVSGSFTHFGVRYLITDVYKVVHDAKSFLFKLGRPILLTTIGGASLVVKDIRIFHGYLNDFKKWGIKMALLAIKGAWRLEIRPWVGYVEKTFLNVVSNVSMVVNGMGKLAFTVFNNLVGCFGNALNLGINVVTGAFNVVHHLAGDAFHVANTVVHGAVHTVDNVAGAAVHAADNVVHGAEHVVNNVAHAVFGWLGKRRK